MTPIQQCEDFIMMVVERKKKKVCVRVFKSVPTGVFCALEIILTFWAQCHNAISYGAHILLQFENWLNVC